MPDDRAQDVELYRRALRQLSCQPSADRPNTDMQKQLTRMVKREASRMLAQRERAAHQGPHLVLWGSNLGRLPAASTANDNIVSARAENLRSLFAYPG